MYTHTKGIFFTLVLFICLSCSQGEQTNASVADKVVEEKKEMVQKKKAGNIESKRSIQSTSQNNYWQSLKIELALDEGQVKEIRSLNEKNNTQIQTLRTDKPDNFSGRIKKIRMSEKEMISKILGEERYQKKLEHDRKWAETHSPKVPEGKK